MKNEKLFYCICGKNTIIECFDSSQTFSQTQLVKKKLSLLTKKNYEFSESYEK